MFSRINSLGTQNDTFKIGKTYTKPTASNDAMPKDRETYDAIVDAGGNGDYTTLGAAVSAGNSRVFVRDGVYTEIYVNFTTRSKVVLGEGVTMNFNNAAANPSNRYIYASAKVVISGGSISFAVNANNYNIGNANITIDKTTIFISNSSATDGVFSMKTIDCSISVSNAGGNLIQFKGITIYRTTISGDKIDLNTMVIRDKSTIDNITDFSTGTWTEGIWIYDSKIGHGGSITNLVASISIRDAVLSEINFNGINDNGHNVSFQGKVDGLYFYNDACALDFSGDTFQISNSRFHVGPIGLTNYSKSCDGCLFAAGALFTGDQFGGNYYSNCCFTTTNNVFKKHWACLEGCDFYDVTVSVTKRTRMSGCLFTDATISGDLCSMVGCIIKNDGTVTWSGDGGVISSNVIQGDASNFGELRITGDGNIVTSNNDHNNGKIFDTGAGNVLANNL